MKIAATAALAVALIATAIPAGAVSYSHNATYRNGGVMLRMSVPMGSVLSPGEQLAFKYQTLQDSYVIVFNIDSEGYVHLLHPEDGLSMSAARNTYDVPEGRNSTLLVSGETGMEFVFALSVPERSFIDEDELSYLFSLDTDENALPYRVDGDPFLAANIIAAELVRGISRRSDVYLDFTYFYINQRVDHPCYLCGECDRRDTSSECERYQIVAAFERTEPMTYPLERAYEMVDQGVAFEYQPEVIEEPRETQVTFYPYTTEVYTYSRPWVYRVVDPWWYDPWYWDPWYCGWYYYPTPGWSWGVTIGWGWGGAYWGWGGGYCGWGGGYWGWGGYSCYYPRDRYYADPYTRPERFKTKYKAPSTLVATRQESMRRDAGLRVATRGVNTRSTTATTRIRSTSATRTSTRVALRGNTTRARSFRQAGTTTRRTTGTRVTGTSRDRVRTTNRGTAVTRGTRNSTRVRTYTGTNTRRTIDTRGTTRTRTQGVNRNTTRSRSTGRSTVRSQSNTTSKNRSAVRGTTRSTNRSSVRSSGRSGSTRSRASSGRTRSGGSRRK